MPPPPSKRQKGHHSNQHANWSLEHTIPIDVPISDPTFPEKFADAKGRMEDYLRVNSKDMMCKWLAEDDKLQSAGTYSHVSTCRNKDLGFCNARVRVRYQAGVGLQLHVWTLSTAHGITSPSGKFASLAEHTAHGHMRAAPSAELRLDMVDLIEELLLHHPKMPPAEIVKQVMGAQDDNGLPLFPFTDAQWTMIKPKIRRRRQSVLARFKRERGKIVGDNLSDIQEYAMANTFEKRRSDPDFNKHTMVVIAHEVIPDPRPVPMNRAERATFVRRDTCRVVLSSIYCALIVPALCARGDISGAVRISSDATYKLFICTGFHLLIIFAMDATRNAKIIGMEISCSENAGDFYLLGNAVRNFSEYLCALLPRPAPSEGEAEEEEDEGVWTWEFSLPFNLKSPVPPATPTHPMRMNSATKLLEQDAPPSGPRRRSGCSLTFAL